MGYDRVRYFNGVNKESTLISADKASTATLYSYRFKALLQKLGFGVRTVVDLQALPASEHLQTYVNQQRVCVVDFPATARLVQYDRPLADRAVEIKPPLDEATERVVTAYLVTHCEPNDAGIIIDHRGDAATTVASY